MKKLVFLTFTLLSLNFTFAQNDSFYATSTMTYDMNNKLLSKTFNSYRILFALDYNGITIGNYNGKELNLFIQSKIYSASSEPIGYNCKDKDGYIFELVFNFNNALIIVTDYKKRTVTKIKVS